MGLGGALRERHPMLSEQPLAYEALIEFELTGTLPDQESFDAAYKELIETEQLADRYRKLVDECQLNENSRHSRPSSSPSSDEESTADL